MVDQTLADLRRQFQLNSNNEDLRSQLIVRLMREGLDAEANQLIKDRFNCPYKWSDHQVNPESGQRFCEECQRFVHFVSNLDQLHEGAINNQCLVAPESLVEEYCGDLSRDRDSTFGDRAKQPHCLTATSHPIADLNALEYWNRPLSTPSEGGFVPMVEKDVGPDWTLILVSAAPIDELRLEDIRRGTPFKSVENHVTTVEELKRLFESYRPRSYGFRRITMGRVAPRNRDRGDQGRA